MCPASSPIPPKPEGTRVAGIDFGKVRVGVAVSDELGLLAHARPTLDGRDRRALLADLRELAQREAVSRFVVGWPLDPHGQPGLAANRAERFAESLEKATGVPVELLDERWTTVQAERRLQEGGHGRREARTHVDAVAATLILQTWLDRAHSAADGDDGSLVADPPVRDVGANAPAGSRADRGGRGAQKANRDKGKRRAR